MPSMYGSNLYRYGYNKLDPGMYTKAPAAKISTGALGTVTVNGVTLGQTNPIAKNAPGWGGMYSPEGWAASHPNQSYGYGGGSGSNGGGGGGGGYRVAPRPNYEKYYAGKFKAAPYRSQAAKIIDKDIAEQIRQNSVKRAEANRIYQRALDEIAIQQAQGTGQLQGQHATDEARMNNVLSNRRMESGGGAMANVSQMENAFMGSLGNLIAQYQTQRRQQQNTNVDMLNQLLEADRVVRNQRGGLIEELYRQLYKDAYDVWSQDEARRLAAINQRNSTLG